MDTLTFSVEYTADDWRAYQMAARRHQAISNSARAYTTSIPIAAAIIFSALLAPQALAATALWRLFAIAIVWVSAVLVLRRLHLNASKPPKNSMFLGICTLEFDQLGVRTSRPGVAATYDWNRFQTVDRQGDTLYLWLDKLSGLIVPLRSLPATLSAEAAESTIRTLHANGAPRTAILQAQQSSPPSPLPVDSNPTLLQRLIDVCRLWLLRSSRNTSKVATEPWIVTLAVLTLCLWIALDRLSAGTRASFMSWNIPALGSCVLLVLFAAFIAARVSAPKIPFRIAMYIAAAVAPLLVGVWWLAHTRIGRVFAFTEPLLGVYALAYVALNLRRLTGLWQVRATALLLVAFGLTCAADQLTYWSAAVWVPAPAGDEEDYDLTHRKAESLLFDQRSKIDALVNGFNISPDTKPRIFFVGFAGVAGQRVFAEEIKFGAKVVAERFNVKDRRLLLLNDRRDLTRFPIGTVTSLAYGLKLIGQKMNPDRDILFLALSSHGSSDPQLSVSNGMLSLQQLTGEDLSAALQASGIKRSIIVISACHAGAFIPSLKGPDSIIITASAANKTSFGCSDDRDLTYFGEAFYRDALPTAQSLQEAFKQAKQAIALREIQEHQKASDPQAYFGIDLQHVLEENPMSPPNDP